jgi:hypothetical protein
LKEILESLSFEKKLPLGKVPKQWAQRIELFYPDIHQFPIIYVHLKADTKRIYGFPVRHTISKPNPWLPPGIIACLFF